VRIYFENTDLSDVRGVEDTCWRMLSDAVVDRTHAMRTMVIGTVSELQAKIRTVVLRKVEPEHKKIFFHTDIRSTKIGEILATGQLSWLAYDAHNRTQLRLSGPTAIHHGDAIAQMQWGKTQHSSRRCYLLPQGPGQKITPEIDTAEQRLSHFSYTMKESEEGFRYFAVVETTVDTMEWYYTHHRGNKRIQFCYELGMLKNAVCLTP
jgi:pyridoxamine 5'-phosphate oxidase